MLCEFADSYFSSLNPIAQKISNDIKAVKATYENLWSSFSLEEQHQVINEKIIQPEVLFKYSLNLNEFYSNGSSMPSALGKIITDENTGTSWRDEHAGPFNWKTMSQLNLCLFNNAHNIASLLYPPNNALNENENNLKHPEDTVDWGRHNDNNVDISQQRIGTGDRGIFSKLVSNIVIKLQSSLRVVVEFANGSVSTSSSSRRSGVGEGEALFVGGGAVIVPQTAPRTPSKAVLKPTAPPPPPPVQLQGEMCSLFTEDSPELNEYNDEDEPFSSHCPDDDLCSVLNDKSSARTESPVLKSGFDFLDNW